MHAALTAAEVGDRIRARIARSWDATAGDGLQIGSPETAIRGIVTSWTPSLDVLRHAVATGANMVVARECPFWSREAEVRGYSGAGQTATRADMAKDAAFIFKQRFIEEHGLVLWRLAAHWDAHVAARPVAALGRALGWQGFADGTAGRYALPPTTIDAVAATIRRRLDVRGLRVLGAAPARVRTVALSRGLLLVRDVQTIVSTGDVDLFVAGEPVEWEAFPYVADLVTAGRTRGMILLGHAVSDEPELAEVAGWLTALVPEVPVRHIPAGEPFTAVNA